MRRLCLAVFFAAFVASAASAAELTYVDLVKRLTDLEALSCLPVAGETCSQASSYDRASRFDEAAGKYVRWDANGDNNGIVRTEGDMEVLAEIEGPGCIWRMWSAAPKDGRVKIYLDGAQVPAVDLPFAGYFDCKNRPFNYPALVHYTASGANNYVPIPFAKSCKILAEHGWGAYYHFTYATFPKGTVVPTFKRSLSAEELNALADADKALSTGLGTQQAAPLREITTARSNILVAPGKPIIASRLNGRYAISAIEVKCDLSIEQLRETTIRIYWDGEKAPSVWCPLGDFFGTAPGTNLYKSLPLGMTEEGFYCYWYMPFAKSAVVEFANEGTGKAVNLDVSVSYAKLDRDPAELGRFHVKWHRDAFLPTEPERWIDWPMLKTTGTGRFCGVSLHVFNPKGGWWGEGDEKFFVDGEKLPSTFGTGSEDYFGYAWCNPALFQHAYHNQPYNQNSNAGNVSVNRWHIADNVPFFTSFEADIEKYYLNDRPTLYASTVYWYEAPGGGDPYGPVPVSERIGYFEYAIFTVAGAIEAERMKAGKPVSGQVSPQEMGGFGDKWSNNVQLWWVEGKPGDKLDLTLQVKEAGKYELKTQLTKAPDYGIAQFYIDGAKIGSPIDLFNAAVIPTGEISLGTLDLAKGKRTISVEITGKNEKSAGYLIGIDYFKLDPAK